MGRKALRSRRRGQAAIEYLLMICVGVAEISILYPLLANGMIQTFQSVADHISGPLPLP